MKKTVFLLTLLLAFCQAFPVYAQQWTEVVYLKNGGQIRGVVIEQIPGQSLKIKTSDGSVFVFQMDEVDKITKEQVAPPEPRQRPASNSPATTETSRQKASYYGREKEGKLLLNLGVGIAPSNALKDVKANLYNFIQSNAPSNSAPYYSISDNVGFSMLAGLSYNRFFNKKSPFFWEVGAFAEMEQIGLDIRFKGDPFMNARLTTWNFSAVGGLGVQTAPNKEGLHFYGKAGVGVGYVMIGDVKVRGSSGGEAAGASIDMDSLGYGGYKGEGSVHPRPYAELGFGNDHFFRIALRYSPLLANEGALWCHCIMLGLTIPLM